MSTATATLVLSVDRRTDELAGRYADALGARARSVAVADVGAHVEGALAEPSVTVFALADALDERLLDELWTANRARGAGGRDPGPFGLMTAIAPEQLRWLVAKTLRWLRDGPLLDSMRFADFDGMLDSGAIREVGPGVPAAPADAMDGSEWTDDSTHVAAVFTHSVSFDAHLGDVALCGHMDGLQDFQREHRGAPRCYYDGVCFRLNGRAGAPTRILRAAEASPLVWLLNGCGTIPLARSPFGVRTGYAYGLLAGAALAVVGTHLTQPTLRSRNTVFGALLATGATTGESALALSRMADESDSFHAHPLLGSPDIRLVRAARTEHVRVEDGVARYEFGDDTPWAARLAVPGRGRPVPLVDDGGDGWAHVTTERGRPELLLVSTGPGTPRGWLDVALDDPAHGRLAADAAELLCRLRILRGYEFMNAELAAVDECAALAGALAGTAADGGPVRRRRAAAVLLARIETALGELQRSACERFVAHVRANDFNMDRESYNGFRPGPARRTRRTCPACGDALFRSDDRWLEDPSYVRTKLLCANCFAVSTTLRTAGVRVSPLRLDGVRPGPVATLRLGLNNAGGATRAWIAAAPRHGTPEATAGPTAVDLAAGMRTSRSLTLDLVTAHPGTQSIRAIVLAGGAAQFQSFLLPASALISTS
jgi:hypothetical protein